MCDGAEGGKMFNPEFKLADDFLTALTRELVRRGTKSDRINSFRRAAAGNPEWSKLAEIAIDLRGAYEEHCRRTRPDPTAR